MGLVSSLIAYGVYGDLIRIYPKPYSIYLRGTIDPEGHDSLVCLCSVIQQVSKSRSSPTPYYSVL